LTFQELLLLFWNDCLPCVAAQQTVSNHRHVKVAKTPRVGSLMYPMYTLFHDKDLGPLFHNLLKWWSIYTKFLPLVAEEILIQYFNKIWPLIKCSLLVVT